VNHHDAVTGTSKQHVADDYTKILDKAFTAAEKSVAAKIGALVLPADSSVVLGKIYLLVLISNHNNLNMCDRRSMQNCC